MKKHSKRKLFERDCEEENICDDEDLDDFNRDESYYIYEFICYIMYYPTHIYDMLHKNTF